MNFSALYTELQLPAYSGKTDQEALDMLNASTVFVPAVRFVSYRTLYAILGSEKTNAVATVIASVNPLADKFLMIPGGEDGSGGGVDASSMEFQAMVDQLVGGSVITSGEGATIKQLGGSYISRSTQLGLGTVLLAHVTWTRNHWVNYTALKAEVIARWNLNQSRLDGMTSNLTDVTDLTTLDTP